MFNLTFFYTLGRFELSTFSFSSHPRPHWPINTGYDIFLVLHSIRRSKRNVRLAFGTLHQELQRQFLQISFKVKETSRLMHTNWNFQYNKIFDNVKFLDCIVVKLLGCCIQIEIFSSIDFHSFKTVLLNSSYLCPVISGPFTYSYLAVWSCLLWHHVVQ